jgi:uncharacterized protein
MKVLIDIGHPGQVHYFKNFIFDFIEKGHKILIVARDKEVTFDLLKSYNLPYKSRGKGGFSIVEKLLYVISGDYKIFRISKKFKPDVFLSFGSIYAAHVSFLLGKPHIAFDDTESAFKSTWTTFTNAILVPSCYLKDIGNKHIRFKGYMELCHLYKNRFTPDRNIYDSLKISNNSSYVVLRFVSWQAHHDIGHNGITFKTKLDLVRAIKPLAHVFITSESKLPKELEVYRLKISPEKLHDVLAFASLYIGEGATMASECTMLGTPAIYVNSLGAGTIIDQEKHGLLFNFKSSEGVLTKALELLNNPILNDEWMVKRNNMLDDKIDVTAFMVWFIENYPESFKIMKENPDYQYNFK